MFRGHHADLLDPARQGAHKRTNRAINRGILGESLVVAGDYFGLDFGELFAVHVTEEDSPRPAGLVQIEVCSPQLQLCAAVWVSLTGCDGGHAGGSRALAPIPVGVAVGQLRLFGSAHQADVDRARAAGGGD